MILRFLLGLSIVALSAAVADAQTFASETFDACYTGPISCPGWEGDGTVEEMNGDNILVLRPGLRGTTTATWRIDYGGGLSADRSYRVSAAMRTDRLSYDLALVAKIEGAAGTDTRFTARGAGGTSSWHRLELVFTPAVSGPLAISIELAEPAGDQGQMPGTADGQVFIDDIIVTGAEYGRPGMSFANVCPDGQFANLARSENDCERLHVSLGDLGFAERDILEDRLHIDTYAILDGDRQANLGFDHGEFGPGSFSYPVDTIFVADCRGVAVQAAIDEAAGRNGGIVRLPDCAIPIDTPILIEGVSNLVLEGRGVGRTLLKRLRGNRPAPAILVDRSQNLVIRDLSLHLDNLPLANVNIARSDNVLVERIEVFDAGSSSIRSSHTTRMTVRYSTMRDGPKAFSDAGCQGHWFAGDQPSSNDRDRDGKGSIDECELKWGSDMTPGAVWSAGYSAYSNIAVESSFSLHLTLAEVAGNRFVRTAGNKLADAHFIWLHDNEFRDNAAGANIATFRTSTDGIVDRIPAHIVVYDNLFVDNRNVPVRVMERDVFVVDNEYLGGASMAAGKTRLLKLGDRASICSGTIEHSLLLSGDLGANPPRVVDMDPGGVCDLTDPGTFWSRADVSSGQ